jgi:beta-glucosidase
MMNYLLMGWERTINHIFSTSARGCTDRSQPDTATHLARYLLAVMVFGGSTAALGDSLSDPDARAAKVEQQMTMDERFQLLHGIMALPLPIPGMAPLPEGVPFTAGYVKGIPRLGIPDILETDAGLGVVNPRQVRPGDVATAMPSGLALASSFDSDLAYQGGAVIGAEARAKGFNVLLGGGVNLTRDPRNGRNFEYLGEDPLLAGILAGATIAGTQSQGIVSTVKHFVLNAQETQRHTLDARIDEAGLREADLLAFELAIEGGHPGSIMCAYNKVNEDYSCGNEHLLKQVLKRDWGYKGWVMSDWGAVHDVSYFGKGLDQQSGSQLDKQVWFAGPLQAEVAAGRVSESRITDAVRRILRSLYAVGADRESPVNSIDYVAHAKVAHQAADEGIVLLKNEDLLPLSPATKSVLVIGGHADLGVLSGGGSSQVTPYGGTSTIFPIGSSGRNPFSRALYMPSEPLKALKSALPDTRVDFQSGYDVESAAINAAQADVVIVFATQWQSEGYDHASMELPEGQNTLIAAIATANRNTIVVLETGNPVKMPWLARVRAVIEAWYPGEEGGSAIADIITGAVNPSGHLPISFPTDESQLPRATIPGLGLMEGTPVSVEYSEGSKIGYRWYAAHNLNPLFPFGHGLSYTGFDFKQLRLVRGRATEAAVTASFTVRNTGQRAGAAVPQLYLISALGKPLFRLVGFSRLSLEPQETRDVRLTLDPRFFGHWDTANNRWQIDRGRYVIALGYSATALTEQAALTLPGRTMVP